MLKTIVMVSVASVFAAVLSASASSPIATPSAPVIVGKYEIRNADRGMSKRVKVFFEGERIATITLRRGEATYYCCTADGCKRIEAIEACSSIKVACDAEGNCSAG
jgi:hypothetical protein